MICNEIFGENNFLTQFVWQKRTSPDMRKLVSTAHEYVCTYCKDISYLPNAISKVASSEEDAENYKNTDNDPVVRGHRAILQHRAFVRTKCMK